MLSKQEKLRYGQQLRKQMLQKQERKKIEKDQKKGIYRSPTDTHIVPNVVQNNSYHEKPNQNFQNKFQKQQHNYPQALNHPKNTHDQPQFDYNMQPNHITSQARPYQQYPPRNQQVQPNRMKTHQQYQVMNHKQNTYNYEPQIYNQQYNHHPYQEYTNYPPHQKRQPQHYQNYIPNLNQQTMINQRFPTDRSLEQLGPPRNQYPHDYMHQNNARGQQQQQQYYKNSHNDYNQLHNQGIDNQYLENPLQQINQKHLAYRQKTVQNDELMQIHKKGGRNLLQLENMSIQQQNIKNKQKQQMRKQLEIQMKQAAQKKMKEKQKIQREEQEQQRRNQEYLRQQKMRLQEEQRKNQQKQRQIQEQNLKNLEQRKRLQQEAKEKARQQKNKNHLSNKQSMVQTPRNIAQQNFSRQIQQIAAQTTSQASSSTFNDQAFKTNTSKQYFRNQRHKNQQNYNREKQLEVVTDEIQKLKNQVQRQNQMYLDQIKKIKLEAEMAQRQKYIAQRQIEDLKKQLKQKNQDDNQRLFKALQKQQKLKNQISQVFQDVPQPRKQTSIKQDNDIVVLKPQNNKKMSLKKYSIPEQNPTSYNSDLQLSNISDEGLVSLRGESKKIPINLPNDKLSISQVSQYARETKYFKNDGRAPKAGRDKSNFNVHESIVQEDEQRLQSRAKTRQQSGKPHQKDQLDQLLESRQNGWGQMSSVNSDITKEIEDLLKKKDKQQNNNNYGYQYHNSNNYQSNMNKDRPSSHLSNAGKRALSREGMVYEGASINTINSNGHGTINTFDIDRINNKNEARLNEFRKLGVQTINSNDGQLSKLDQILNRYKEEKSRIL